MPTLDPAARAASSLGPAHPPRRRRNLPTLPALTFVLAAVTPGAAETVLSDRLAECGAPAAATALAVAATEHAGGVETPAPEELESAKPAVRLAAHTARLSEQLGRLVDDHAAFSAAWQSFSAGLGETDLARRDPGVRSLLPSYEQSAAALAELVGCGTPKFADGLMPCEGIPIAHGLAVAAEQIHGYFQNRYAEAYPDVIPLAAELDRRAAAFHDLVHAIEFSVPDVQNAYAELTAPPDALRQPFETLNELVGACRDPSELSEDM